MRFFADADVKILVGDSFGRAGYLSDAARDAADKRQPEEDRNNDDNRRQNQPRQRIEKQAVTVKRIGRGEQPRTDHFRIARVKQSDARAEPVNGRIRRSQINRGRRRRRGHFRRLIRSRRVARRHWFARRYWFARRHSVARRDAFADYFIANFRRQSNFPTAKLNALIIEQEKFHARIFFGVLFEQRVAFGAGFFARFNGNLARYGFDAARKTAGKSRIRTKAKIKTEKHEKNRREQQQIEKKPDNDSRKKRKSNAEHFTLTAK